MGNAVGRCGVKKKNAPSVLKLSKSANFGRHTKGFCEVPPKSFEHCLPFCQWSGKRVVHYGCCNCLALPHGYGSFCEILWDVSDLGWSLALSGLIYWFYPGEDQTDPRSWDRTVFLQFHVEFTWNFHGVTLYCDLNGKKSAISWPWSMGYFTYWHMGCIGLYPSRSNRIQASNPILD